MAALEDLRLSRAMGYISISPSSVGESFNQPCQKTIMRSPESVWEESKKNNVLRPLEGVKDHSIHEYLDRPGTSVKAVSVETDKYFTFSWVTTLSQVGA